MSLTRLTVTRDPRGGRVRVDIGSDGPRGRGHLGLRVLAAGPAGARVAVLAEGALLLADDDVGVAVRVGAGVCLEVVEPAGTVAYDMRGGSARWTVGAQVGPEARLIWRGEPFVVSDGAEVHRTLDLDLRERAVAVLRETLVLGRSAERGGVLHQVTRVFADGAAVLAEDLRLDGSRPRVGVLAGARVLDTVSVLGARATGIPTPAGAHRLELDAAGSLLRAATSAVHCSPLDKAWRAAAAAPQESVPGRMRVAS